MFDEEEGNVIGLFPSSQFVEWHSIAGEWSGVEWHAGNHILIYGMHTILMSSPGGWTKRFITMREQNADKDLSKAEEEKSEDIITYRGRRRRIADRVELPLVTNLISYSLKVPSSIDFRFMHPRVEELFLCSSSFPRNQFKTMYKFPWNQQRVSFYR